MKNYELIKNPNLNYNFSNEAIDFCKEIDVLNVPMTSEECDGVRVTLVKIYGTEVLDFIHKHEII